MTANSELEDGGGVHLSVSDILPKLDVNMDQLAKKSAAELITVAINKKTNKLRCNSLFPLLQLVGQMNDVIQQQVSQLHAVLNERDRFEQIIERTNMSLMELKVYIDRHVVSFCSHALPPLSKTLTGRCKRTRKRSMTTRSR